MTYISESPRQIVSLHAKKGFTMIELLLVIVIVGSLATSALPAMLDFRNLGRKAAAQALLNALRSGMKNQVNNIRLRCDAPVGAVLTKAALQQNSVLISMGSSWAVNGGTPAGTCNSTQVRNSVDGRILDTGSTMPNNPFTEANGIYTDGAGPGTRCTLSDPSIGWCYRTSDGFIHLNSDVVGEASL